MRVVTVQEVECWGCHDVTVLLRFYGRSGHRRMDICGWCLAESIELIFGVGLVRMLRQWTEARNASIFYNRNSKSRFVKVPKRFQHK